MGRIIFNVPESNHPFVGMGDGIIVTDNGKEEAKITIKFPLYGIEITTLKGEEAKNLISQMSSDSTDDDRIEYAQDVVCKILSINRLQLNKAKTPQGSFGRMLVWKYAKDKMNMSFSKCGRIFNMPHSTVHSALKRYNKVSAPNNIKYMEGWKQSSIILFNKEMERYMSVFQTEK